MRHLEIFENFNNIDNICKKYGIRNYTINDDGSIDVDGEVDLSRRNLTKLPLKFRNVSGTFACHINELTSLEGAPKFVGRHFSCSRNLLKSLEGAPKFVDGEFSCGYNQLISLKGSPKSVGGSFYCQYNMITSLKGGPESVGVIFECSNNRITTFEGAPTSIGALFYCYNNPIYNIWDLIHGNIWDEEKMTFFNELDIIQDGVIILDRLNHFLKSIGRDPVDSVEGYKIEY